MKNIVLILCSILILNTAQSQVTLNCDFGNADHKRQEIHNFWSVRNRPANSEGMFVDNSREGSNLNCVRIVDNDIVSLDKLKVIHWKDQVLPPFNVRRRH